MELKQLYYLTVCAETKSFTKAATSLFTAQSNVSKVIKTLESELGFELFERKQYGIVLTERGRKVYEYAQQTLKSASKILDFSNRQFREELKISFNPSSWMAAAFCEYYKKYEQDDVDYSIMTASTNEIIARMAGEQDQLGFLYVMEPQVPYLQNRLSKNHLFFTPLTRTSAMLYTRRPLKEGERRDIALVQGYDDEFTLRSYWNEEQEREIEKHRIAVTTNSDYVMNFLLRETDLGNISGGYLGKENPGVNGFSLYGEETPVIFGYLTRNDRNLSPLTIQFLKFIKKRLSEEK